MATPVPYNPVPSVAATGQPAPFKQEYVPEAAFGGAVAAARQEQGKTLENVGNELFGRAVAMQEMDQAAKANEAVAKAASAQIDQLTDFSQLEGKAASDGLEPFKAQMEATRMQIRGASGLSPYAQRLYDNETRNFQNRMLMSGAMHAKEQFKKYNVDTANAGIEVAKRAIGVDPSNPASIDASMKSIEDKVNEKAKILGWSDTTRDDEMFKAKSGAATDQIMAMGRSDKPEMIGAAKKLISEYASDKRKILDAQQASKLGGWIDGRMAEIGSSGIANDILTGKDSSFGDKVTGIEAAKIAVRGSEVSGRTDPGVYSQEGPLVTSGQYKGQRAIGPYQIMPGNLPQWLSEAGMPSITAQEFKANPAAQEQLFEFKFGQMMKKDGSLNRALKEWFTGDPSAPDDRSDGYHTAAWYVQRANAELARRAPERDQDAAARARAEQLDPGNPLLADRAAMRIISRTAEERRVEAQDRVDAQDTVLSGLEPDAQGRVPTTQEGLLNTPEKKAAWDKLKESQKLGVLSKLRANAMQGGFTVTPENEETFNEMTGIGLNPDATPEERQKLIDFDPTTWQAPTKMVRAVSAARARVFKEATADPNLQHAMRVLDTVIRDPSSELEFSGADRPNMNQFRGALYNMLQDYQNLHKKPPDDDTILRMGSQLLQEKKGSGFLGSGWFASHYPAYQSDVPTADRQVIVDLYRQRYNGAMPNEQQIHSLWIAAQYKEMFSPTPKAPGQKFERGGPAVPVAGGFQ